MVQTRARVLVVDDEESIRNALRQALVDEGHDVLLASDGEHALELLRTNDIEVMLLDVRMPGLSGLAVLDKVQARWPDTCVIMVTAIADMSTAVDAMKRGAYDYVAKPFVLDEVTMAVRRALERRTLVLLDRQRKRELEERLGEQEARLHEQFAQLVGSLAREHSLVLTVERLHGSKRGSTNGASALPEELRSPVGGVERFAEALRAAIRSGSLSARQGKIAKVLSSWTDSKRVMEERLKEQEIRLREQFAELVQALGRKHGRLSSTNDVMT